MRIRSPFEIFIFQHYGSKREAARRWNIPAPLLSMILLHGLRPQPTAEKRIIKNIGIKNFREFLGEPRYTKVSEEADEVTA